MRIIPFLVAMLTAIGMFRGSAGDGPAHEDAAPGVVHAGFPGGPTPMVLMRPLSGSGSLGLFHRHCLPFRRGRIVFLARTAWRPSTAARRPRSTSSPGIFWRRGYPTHAACHPRRAHRRCDGRRSLHHRLPLDVRARDKAGHPGDVDTIWLDVSSVHLPTCATGPRADSGAGQARHVLSKCPPTTLFKDPCHPFALFLDALSASVRSKLHPSCRVRP